MRQFTMKNVKWRDVLLGVLFVTLGLVWIHWRGGRALATEEGMMGVVFVVLSLVYLARVLRRGK